MCRYGAEGRGSVPGVPPVQSTASWTRIEPSLGQLLLGHHFLLCTCAFGVRRRLLSRGRVKRRNDSYRWNSRRLASLPHTGSGLERRSGRGRTPWCSELRARGDTLSTYCFLLRDTGEFKEASQPTVSLLNFN